MDLRGPRSQAELMGSEDPAPLTWQTLFALLNAGYLMEVRMVRSKCVDSSGACHAEKEGKAGKVCVFCRNIANSPSLASCVRLIQPRRPSFGVPATQAR